MREGKVSAELLKSHVEREIRLYKEYIQVLEKEKDSVTSYDSQRLEKYTAKREGLHNEIRDALFKRQQMIKTLCGSEKVRLTDAIKNHFHIADTKKLIPIAEQLKELTIRLQKQSREFNQIVNFGLNVVNGSLSIIMSATQNITKAYNKKGVVKESFNPQGGRNSGVLKEA